MKKCFLIVLLLCFCLGGCRDNDSSTKVTFEYYEYKGNGYVDIVGIKDISPPQPIGGIDLVIPQKVPNGELAGVYILGINCRDKAYENIKSYLNVKSITISKRAAFSISPFIFKNCNNLEFFNSSADVLALGAGLFEGCDNLKTVNILADIVKLESSLFNGCKNLKTIRLDVKLPPYFIDSPKVIYDELPNPELKILVPKGSVEEYKKDDVWKKYADRIEAIP